MMKTIQSPLRVYSRIAAWLSWILLSALSVFIIWGLRDRARLIRDKENEQILNILFTSFRDYDDFGVAIESNPTLRERIAGFAVYGDNLERVYAWGTVPPAFDETRLEGLPRSRFGRYTLTDATRRSVIFVLSIDRPPDRPPPPYQNRENRNPRGSREERGAENRNRFPLLGALADGKYLYIEVSHPAYWRTITGSAILFFLIEGLLLCCVFQIRRLYLRNREYRERIESQKNLVVLGTAASTLAHEIKNPLLAIRLQTGILEKLYPGMGSEELGIINEEVDRVSALIYRVNDYLRDARGTVQALDCRALLGEVFRRLCGRELSDTGPEAVSEAAGAWTVYADPSRLRSVFENLLRNALESGGSPAEVEASLSRSGGQVLIDIVDQGRGIPPEELGRIFDPFYTRKSGGTGIGLSVSKRFVEAAGGSLTLENREGGGALARVALPEE